MIAHGSDAFVGLETPPSLILPPVIRQKLRDVFHAVLLPSLKELDRKPETIRHHLTCLDRWEAYWASILKDLGNTRIPHPRFIGEPLPIEVTRQDLLDWRRWLPTAFEMSSRTINKHVSAIQAILAADAELHGRPTIKVKALPETKAASKLYFTRDQISALYQAADAAQWPKLGELAPGDAWRCAIVIWFNYGLRTQELMAYEPRHEPLRVRQFHWEEETPSDVGTATNKHGWFTYLPQKQKGHKPTWLVLPMNRVTAAHVKLVLRSRRAKQDEPLLPIPRCNRAFYQAWSAILRAAKVRPKRAIDGTDRDFHIKHLRKSAATYLNHHKRGLAPLVMGHADEDSRSQVSDVHYDNPELELVEGLNSFPQPSVFEDIFDRGKQLTLF